MFQQSSAFRFLRRTAERAAPDHGVLFYETPEDKAFLSYRELDQQARALADALVRRGYGPGDIAVLGLPGGLEFFRAAYGALLAGLAIAPTPVAGAPDAETIIARIAPIAKHSGARLVLTDAGTDSALAGRELPWEPHAETLIPSELLASGDPDRWVAPDLDEHALWALLYTSGSTGQPKGVMLTHGNLMGTLESFTRMLGLAPQTPLVAWMPFHHTAGILVQVFLAVYAGSPIVITPTSQFQRHPIFWMQLMSEHRAVYSVGVNFAYDLLAQLATDEQVAELDLSSVRSLMTGAEPVRMDTIRRFTDRFGSAGIDESVFMPVFAMTEAPVVAFGRPGDPVIAITADVDALERGRLVAALGGGRTVDVVAQGRPGPLHTVRIVDPVELTAVPDGSVGEIWVAGPGVAVGYWRNPTASAESFGNALPGDANAYYRTGDLGAMLDGQVYVTGRLKDVIIFRGRNIYPQDLEAAAVQVPGVGIGAAFELTDHPSVVGIVAEFDAEKVTDGAADPAAAIEALRALLIERFSLPSVAVALLAPGTLPRTAAGKVQRSITRSAIEHGRLDLIASRGFAPVRDAEPVA